MTRISDKMLVSGASTDGTRVEDIKSTSKESIDSIERSWDETLLPDAPRISKGILKISKRVFKKGIGRLKCLVFQLTVRIHLTATTSTRQSVGWKMKCL